MEFKKSLSTTLGMIIIVFIIAAFVGNIKNAEKVGFFTGAERLIVYKLEIEEARAMGEEELAARIIYETDNIASVFKNVTVEEVSINTEGCYYARLYQKDGTVEDLIFADYGKAFVRVNEEGRIYRYGLVNRDDLFDEGAN